MREHSRKPTVILAGAMILIALAVLYWDYSHPLTFAIYEADGVDYRGGVVEKVVKNELNRTDTEKNRLLGYQQLVVRIAGGPHKGKTVTVDNDITQTHHILCKKGTRVILKCDTPEEAEAYYTIYNYDRRAGYVALFAVFVLLMLFFGRKKGLRALAGLLFAVFLIFFFLLPALFQGMNPLVLTFLTIGLITFFCATLLVGLTRQAKIAMLAAACGLGMSAGIYLLFSRLLHLSGYNLESAEELILIRQGAGMQVFDLLFVLILISSLGAVLDTAISLVSSLHELEKKAPDLGKRERFASGMRIGQDIIGANCQTLVLAFAGSSLTTLLVVISYGFAANQLLNADFIAIELLQGICGSLAVVFTVPAAAALTVYLEEAP